MSHPRRPIAAPISNTSAFSPSLAINAASLEGDSGKVAAIPAIPINPIKATIGPEIKAQLVN